MKIRLLPSNSSGQSVLEFAVMLPIIMVMSLGVVETGYVLLDQHVVTKLTREGSNLISRDVSLGDAATAMRKMSTAPVDFNADSKLIFSVLKKGATVGSTNYDKVILYQRYEFGNLAGASSTLSTRGSGSFRGAPDYQANNADTDANLQLAIVPANLDIARGGMLYITEVYTKHTLITPVDRFGILMPQTLYSVAYF